MKTHLHMKQILISLMTAWAVCATDNVKAAPESDTLPNATTVESNLLQADTACQDTLVLNAQETTTETETDAESKAQNVVVTNTFDMGELAGIIAIIAAFGTPTLIVFLVFYFRHKNQQARYHLIEQAIVAGQPIPEALFKEKENSLANLFTSGIKNIFLGIGLFFFILLLTDEIGVASVGFLLVCIGIGQSLSDYLQRKRTAKENQDSDIVVTQKETDE